MSSIALALLLLHPFISQEHVAAGLENVTITARHLTKRTVNGMQQGQFIEILCNLIPSIIAQQVVSTSFEEAPACKVAYKAEIDEPHRPWYPDGAVEVAKYSFDTANAFNGARSEKIEISASHSRAGISQDGFYLKKGVSYKLRLHMRSDRGVQVRASLHGEGGTIAAPVMLGRAGADWTSADVELKATRTVENATLTIDFEGPGTVWLDRVYLIGSDAVLGIWRPDVVAALAAMHPGVIRFGGSTTENYDWEGGVGPWDKRQPFTTVWGGLEENFVGIDEFVGLCKHIGAEPLICVRWTGKRPEDAAAEVEYCNGGPETHWGALRAKNGHRESYGVKYWQIGNEVDVPEYNSTVRSFADAMRKADPSLKLISSFPTESLLAAAGTAFDYLAPHHYEIDDLAHEDQSFESLQHWITQSGGGRDIRVAVTEWNTTAGDWGVRRGMLQTLANGLSVARYLNLLQRYADLVDIGNRSNFADSFGSGFVVTGPGWIYESPAYYAQKLYAKAAGTYPLKIERSSTQAWPDQQPDISACVSADGTRLLVYGVNTTAQATAVRFRFQGLKAAAAKGTVYTLQDKEGGQTTEVMNSRDDPERISVSSRQQDIQGGSFDFSFKPFTLTLLELGL